MHNRRPQIPKEKIIQVVSNTKKIDFDKPYKFLYFEFWFDLVTFIPFVTICTMAYLCSFYFSLRIQGRQNLKIWRKTGCIFVCNHCHYFDTVFAGLFMLPRRLYITVAQRNFEVPYVRRLLRVLRTFPIPARRSGFKMITDPIGEALKRKHSVLFLPEGDLVHLSQTIHRFQRGAFYQSYIHQVPLIPMVYVQQRRRLFGKEMGPNWIKMTLVIGEPIQPPQLRDDNKYPTLELAAMSETVASWMETTIETHPRGAYAHENNSKAANN